MLVLGESTGPLLWGPDGRVRVLDLDRKGFTAYRVGEGGYVPGALRTPDLGSTFPAVADHRAPRRLAGTGGHVGFGNAVNAQGVVVGYASRTTPYGVERAAAWVAGVPLALEDTLPAPLHTVRSRAQDVNLRGQVVGSIDADPPTGQRVGRAVMWELLPRW